MRALGLVGAISLLACYRPAPEAGAPCSPAQPCPTGQSCAGGYCVVGTPDLDACTTSRCDGDTLLACTGATACSYGCLEAAEGAHCRRLAPSNGLDLAWLDGATAVIDDAELEIDTADGEIRSRADVIREAGEGLKDGIGFHIIDGMGVFSAHSFELPRSESWVVTGNNAPVLLAATTIVIAGTIDIGAFGPFGGPGGRNGASGGAVGPGCRGQAGKAFAVNFGEGGGGAGGATAGGDGAPANQGTFGSGGGACSVPSTIPLRGGNGGGAGGIDSVDGSLRGGAGGGGGGAIALVALDAVTVDGTVGAPGGGGLAIANGDGGGGGGGGGAILVEAPWVTINGRLTANGGGGAGPSSVAGVRGHLGDAVPAAGGAFNGKLGGRGGAGALAPSNGQTFTDGLDTLYRGGGGGGAVGKIEVRALNSSIAGTAVTSPGAARTTADLQ